MSIAPLLDAEFFRSAQRTIPVPFQIRLLCNGRPATLTCHEIVRIVPGKRIVAFSEWNKRPIAIKIFLQHRRSRRHYSRELGGLNALENVGVKSPNVVFTGRFLADDLPVLGLERIAPGETLESLWAAAGNDAARHRLLAQVISVLAVQHAAGLRQEDLHFGNFIFRNGEIYTLDGNAVNKKDKGNPLSPRKSLQNLALFFAQIPPRYDRWAPELFDIYTRRRTWAVGSEAFTQKLLHRLQREIGRKRRHRRRVVLKKIYRECSAFTCRKTRRLWMICRRDRFTPSMEELLKAPDRYMDSGRRIKNGNSSTVSLVELEGRKLVIKRYNIKSFWHGLKRCLRPSRASRSWHNAHLLRFLGAATPEPVAFLEKRWGPLRSTAYYITDHVEGTDVSSLLGDSADAGGDRGQVIDRFAELLALCRGSLISHGDFKATNFLFAEGQLYLCDLDGLRRHRLSWKFERAFARDCRRLLQNWSAYPETQALFRRIIDSLRP